MRVAVLTSSRADFGIYLPLLRKLKTHESIELEVIAFGTHLSAFHGYTLKEIEKEDFSKITTVESMILGDSEEAISTAMAATGMKFSSLWADKKADTDLIICLGDRYEMFAAVAASLPFNIPIAHFHGGETSLGAIDNKFRHAITMMSDYHFTATDSYRERVVAMVGESAQAFSVGALSLDDIADIPFYSKEEFIKKFNIDLNKPTVLTTFHPETVSVSKNERYAEELAKAFKSMNNYQVVITMPNADTQGNIIRAIFQELIEESSHVIGVESFGKLGYFSCMKHCKFLLGNTSSGIIEAASFDKYVINVGDRQKGRAHGENVIDCPINYEDLLQAVSNVARLGTWNGSNIYYQENVSDRVIKVLESISNDVLDSVN